MKDVANAFLNHDQVLLDAGELSPRTFENYKVASDTLVAHLGKARLVADLDPQDFAGSRVRWRRSGGRTGSA